MNFNVRRGSLQRNTSPLTSSDSKVERDPGEEGALPIEVRLNRTLYITELLIGSNKDRHQVLVDTGSSDLWFMSSDVYCLASTMKQEEGRGGKSELQSRELAQNQPMSKRSLKDNQSANSNLVNLADFLGETEYPDPGNEIVSTDSNPITYNETNICKFHGSFNTEESDTFVHNNTGPFETNYADDTYAKGIWGYDTVGIGNTSIANLNFAVVNESSSDFGVLGLGLQLWESVENLSHMYENLPMKLKSVGVIDKAMYSLYLDNADALSGTVLFGAVDHAKYEGTLETLPVRKTYDEDAHPTKFQVMINQLTINNKTESLEILVGSDYAVLDSSSTLSYFRKSQIRDIVKTLNGQFSSFAGAYVIDCSYKNSESTLDITFTNKTIRVPVSDLVIESPLNSTCYLGILEQSVGSLYILFGDNILKNAYIVYDLEDYEIHIGQAYYTDDEDIETVEDNVPTAGGQNVTTVEGSRRSTAKNSGLSLENWSWTYTLGLLFLTII
ncbi:hypothetical protein CANMA_000589 [Candida margitis]|uniref:uncharacterized protein n=1 Tax=Candida margitis TaxID=1775924 RepID=UPI002226BC4A|nr:uncharacterized protein CANMA_000589 [Candida margitis]KAI5970426.1 hypothetical protein CANMA_000589 [Candida margitis]